MTPSAKSGKPVIAVAVEQTNGYARELIRGVADYANIREDLDFRLVAPDEFARHIPEEADGYICRVSSDALAKRLICTRKPVVDLLFNRSYPTFTVVRPDLSLLVQLAVDHFRTHRFQHLAYCGYDGLPFSDLRREAFRAAAAAVGFESLALYAASPSVRRSYGIDLQMISSVNPAPDAPQLATWLAALPRPIAVLCCDDLRARQLLEVCHACSLDVPRDVALLGIDDDPVFCLFSSPRLSSIDPNAYGIGLQAATALSDRLLRHTDATTHLVAPSCLRVRESSETYPINPPWLAEALVFIHRHAAEGISAADVFRHVGYSHTLVQRTFHAIIGRGVQQEIVGTRLEIAHALLRQGTLSISEIARHAGFSSPAYFSRVYAEIYGHAPSSSRLPVTQSNN